MRDYFSKRTYDTLKIIGNFIVPAIGGLYLAVSQIWGAPYGTQIAETCAAVSVFINGICKVDSDAYFGDYSI